MPLNKETKARWQREPFFPRISRPECIKLLLFFFFFFLHWQILVKHKASIFSKSAMFSFRQYRSRLVRDNKNLSIPTIMHELNTLFRLHTPSLTNLPSASLTDVSMATVRIDLFALICRNYSYKMAFRLHFEYDGWTELLLRKKNKHSTE